MYFAEVLELQSAVLLLARSFPTYLVQWRSHQSGEARLQEQQRKHSPKNHVWPLSVRVPGLLGTRTTCDLPTQQAGTQQRGYE